MIVLSLIFIIALVYITPKDSVLVNELIAFSIVDKRVKY
jgi:hypothetical protein